MINIVISLISFVVTLFLGFKAFSNETMKNYYINYIYYVLTANIIIWLFSLIRARNKSFIDEIKNYWNKHYLAVILAIILVALGTGISKPDFRILADETNLLSVSQSLYENHECKNYTSVLYYYYGFKNVIYYELDKRPALFPLTVSFLHSFFGYKPEHIFVVNIISAFLTLLFIYHLVGYKFGNFWGKYAMVILAAYPLFIIYYTSGGFEVFNLLFSLILFWLLYKFMKEPTAINTEALLLFLPLLSQTRYESCTAVFCILPAIFIMLPKMEYWKFSYKLILTPLFFISAIWLRILTDTMKGLQADDKGEAFSLKYFIENTKKAYSFFIGEDLAFGVIPTITFLAIAGLIWSLIEFFIQIYKNKKKSEKLEEKKESFFVKICKENKFNFIFISATTLFYLFHAIIRFAYWGGDLPLRSSSRLGIIFLPIFTYFATNFCFRLSEKFKIRKAYFVICIICLLIVYLPVAGQNLGARDLTLYREFRAAREYLASHFKDKNEFILVANRANMYVPLKYNSVSYRTYTYLILVQLIETSTNQPLDKCSVPKSLKLEKVYETQISADKYLRISKAVFK